VRGGGRGGGVVRGRTQKAVQGASGTERRHAYTKLTSNSTARAFEDASVDAPTPMLLVRMRLCVLGRGAWCAVPGGESARKQRCSEREPFASHPCADLYSLNTVKGRDQDPAAPGRR